MEIKKFIKIYDEVLPWNVLSNFIRFINKQSFVETKVGGGESTKVDFNVRKAFTFPLNNTSNSMSTVHWYNLMFHHFKKKLMQYPKDTNVLDFSFDFINDIEILKYQDNGFYTWHVDHFASIPRTMSCILLLNNDYEGGNLCFRNPDGSGEWELEVKPNRMIIWPSTFLYPHTVKPVTKGIRYSVVAWAL